VSNHQLSKYVIVCIILLMAVITAMMIRLGTVETRLDAIDVARQVLPK